MKDVDITMLISKAEELRALFILGQRVIPFLEEIFIFVKDIKPLLDEINHSIEDNLKKMPNASKQLSKVTEATELATTEIMDVVDGLMNKSDLLQSYNKKMAEFFKSDLVNSGLVNEFDDVNEQSNKLLQSITDDSTSIMISLQVQDITSQQIAAVNHLLEKIQDKLSRILIKFQNTDFGDIIHPVNDNGDITNISQMHRKIAFDPNAVDSYTQKATRQGDVDKIFQSNGEYEPPVRENASADDIDALFGSGKKIADEKDDDNEKSSQDDIDALFGRLNSSAVEKEDDNEPTSQDDIDALFGNLKSSVKEEEVENVKASQDDIDALFGK